MEKKQLLMTWLRQQQPYLEEILLVAANEYYDGYRLDRNFSFDAKKTGKELWLLSQGGDLCYDRPTIGFNYSLWYHPKRINTFLKYFTDLICDSSDENIEIFDLGAGTGAVLWAVGLVAEGLLANNLFCPKIRVINIDTSSFMLRYNSNYLWKNFCLKYTKAKFKINSDYKLNSWSNVDEQAFSNIWLCASYLFDHSENHQQITEDFKQIVKDYRPNKILLLTASKSPKPAFCDKVADGIKSLDFGDYSTTLNSAVFSGSLNKLYEFRSKISKENILELKGQPSWDIDSLYGRVLQNNKPQLTLDFNKLALFVQPEKNRAKITLAPQQKEASAIFDRPTIIIGPAGCGKSVVLTQKIKNILDHGKVNGNYDPNTRILVTTFNKGLVNCLGDWIEQILDYHKFKRVKETGFHGNRSEHSFFTFNNSKECNIYVMHFDLLPTRLGVISGYNLTKDKKNFEDFHIERMNEAIEKYLKENKIDIRSLNKILDAKFLLDEYQRVIYGLECNKFSSFKTIERIGRGNNPQLQYRSLRREIVWGIITIYLTDLKKDKLESFTMRRHRFIKRLRKNSFSKKFSHVLVDEFQDCTQTDYEIFYQLISNLNNLTLAGDIAQSISLGSALHIPKLENVGMDKLIKKNLTGSFRLPFRVSECIKPLSEKIGGKFGEREGVKVDIITPYKGAPPGSRPIFIYAENSESAADKIAEVYNCYQQSLNLDKVSIFERDFPLHSSLRERNVPCESNIILKVKGLEKSCVAWSTRTKVDCRTEKEEFVYTILTRTVSLLIIVMFPDTEQDYIDIIKLLRSDRIICWDEDSEKKYLQIKQIQDVFVNDFDEDNSGEGTVSYEDSLDEIMD